MIFRQILLTCSIRNAWRTIRRICISISGLKVLSGGGVFNLRASRILFLPVSRPIFVSSRLFALHQLQNVCNVVYFPLFSRFPPPWKSRFLIPLPVHFRPLFFRNPAPCTPPPDTHTHTTPLKNLNCMLTDSCCVICILEVGVVMVQRVRVKTLQTPE